MAALVATLRFSKDVKGVRPQTGDHLAHHGVGKLLRKCPERCPQLGSVGIEIGRWRMNYVVPC
jgi:hypothetical protein